MSFLNSNNAEFLSAKITQKGRNAIAKGNFKIEYFQIGDSEFDYTSPFTGLTGLTNQKVFSPLDKESGVKYPYLMSSGGTSYGTPFQNSTIESLRNVMGPAGFVSSYSDNGTTTVECYNNILPYTGITGGTSVRLHISGATVDNNTGVTFNNSEYVTIIFDELSANNVINSNSNSLVYKVMSVSTVTGATISGVTTVYQTLTLDRNTPNLSTLTGNATVISNNCEQEYPISETSTISDSCLSVPADNMGQLNPWTLNVVWDKKPIGGDYNGEDESLTGYTSNQYVSTKELLGYTSTGQTFSNLTGATISGFTSTTIGTGFKNSFNDIIEVKPSEQRTIAIVHYSELGDLRNDPERFFKYDDYISHKTGTTGSDISLVEDENSNLISDNEYFEIYIPFIHYHRNVEDTKGAKFHMDTKDYYVKSTKNAHHGLLFRYLLDEQDNRVGKVFVKNKVVVFDDQELVAILDYRSNRRYTLPSPKLGLIPSDGIAENSMISTTGQTVWVTYIFENTKENTVNGIPSYNIFNGLPCNYFNKISTLVDDGCSIVSPSQITMKFGGSSFSNMTSTTGTTNSFIADKFYALVQTGNTFTPNQWKKIDLTSQIPNYTGGTLITTGTTTGTTDNTYLINPLSLTGFSFTITYSGYTGGTFFDFENHMSGVTTDYLWNTTGIPTQPQFGDEQPFPGSVRLVRATDIEQMKFLVNLPSTQFTTSQNVTRFTGITETTASKYITEIALLDSNKEPLVVAKTPSPIKRVGTQVFAVKLDF
jgi:hypothetical protein